MHNGPVWVAPFNGNSGKAVPREGERVVFGQWWFLVFTFLRYPHVRNIFFNFVCHGVDNDSGDLRAMALANSYPLTGCISCSSLTCKISPKMLHSAAACADLKTTRTLVHRYYFRGLPYMKLLPTRSNLCGRLFYSRRRYASKER